MHHKRSSVVSLGFALLVALVAFVDPPTVVAQVCAGDCNGDGHVSLAEVIVGVHVVLGNISVEDCHQIRSRRVSRFE